MEARFKRIIDISVDLWRETPAFPGDPPFDFYRISGGVNDTIPIVSAFSMSAHVGTHIDSPAHFCPSGKLICEYSAENFILPAVVIDLTNAYYRNERAENFELEIDQVASNSAVLFKTVCDFETEDAYAFHCVLRELIEKLAHKCVEKSIPLVGIDRISIDIDENDDFPTHKILCEAGALILESITLQGIKPGHYTLICLPLKMRNMEASPVRAVLLDSHS